MDAARSAASAARRAGDEETTAELTAEWRSRLRRAGEADEEFIADLKRLMEEFRRLLPGAHGGPVVMAARASGSSRINQAGRDQTVTGG